MQNRSLVRTLSIFLLTLLSVGSLVETVKSADFKQPPPLEPEIEAASSEGEDFMKGIRIPEGWKIQLYAAEPDVANIVAFDIDNRGRLFVCESFRQNRGVTDNRGHDDKWLLADLSAETVQDRIDYHKELLGDAAVTYAQHDDRVRRLEDSDGDGKADRSYVVANGFNRIEEGTGAGVLARGQDIYFTCIPKLWKLVDKDDDGNSDERVVLADGFGVRVAFRGHDMHGLVLGPDGRLYFSIGDRGYHVTTEDGKVLANPESGVCFVASSTGPASRFTRWGYAILKSWHSTTLAICSRWITTATAVTRLASFIFWRAVIPVGGCITSTYQIEGRSIASESGNPFITSNQLTSFPRSPISPTVRVGWLTIPAPDSVIS